MLPGSEGSTYYTLSPLLIIAARVAGLILGREDAQGHVVA